MVMICHQDGVQQVVSGAAWTLGDVAAGMQGFEAAGYEPGGVSFYYRLWSAAGDWETGRGRVHADGGRIQRLEAIANNADGGLLTPGADGWQIAVVAAAVSASIAHPRDGEDEPRNVPPRADTAGVAAGDAAQAGKSSVSSGARAMSEDRAVAQGAESFAASNCTASGYRAVADGGVALGAHAYAGSGIAIGYDARAQRGLAIGAGSYADGGGTALTWSAHSDLCAMIVHAASVSELPDYMPSWREDYRDGAVTQGALWAAGARSDGGGAGDPVDLELRDVGGNPLRIAPDTVFAGTLQITAARADGATYAASRRLVVRRTWSGDTIEVLTLGAADVHYADAGVDIPIAASAGEAGDGMGDIVMLRATVPDDQVWTVAVQLIGASALFTPV